MTFARYLAILYIACAMVTGGSAIVQPTEPKPIATSAQISAPPEKASAPATRPVAPGSENPKESQSRVKRFSEDIGAIFSMAWMITLLMLSIPAVWIIVREWRRDALIVEPFDVPKDLQDLGLAGSVMSQMLADHILELQRSARVDDDAADIVFVELPRLQVDLQLPGMAWSVRATIRYFKQALGRIEHRLVGEVVNSWSVYAIRMRTTSGRARDVPVKFHGLIDLEAALKSAAEVALTLVNPFEAGPGPRPRNLRPP